MSLKSELLGIVTILIFALFIGTIWGIETGQPLGRVNLVAGHVKTQLIAHDKEVYDIAFSRAGGGRDMFASVGADGSVRMFDLR